MPGEGAWQADLKVGDEILEVGGQPVVTFQDMLEAVTLGDAQKGIPLVVRRPGRAELLHTEVTASQAEGRPRIGVVSPATMMLNTRKEIATRAGSPAAETDPPLLSGDKIVKLDDQPVHNQAELLAYLDAHRETPLLVTLQRTLPPEKGSPPAEARTEEVSVRVAPDPMRTLGPIMEMGPVTAIQTGSPAAAAGIQPGDFIRALDGKPVDDPMTLPELFRGHRGETVTLDIERKRKTRSRSRRFASRSATATTSIRPRPRATRWRYRRWASLIAWAIASARCRRALPPPLPASAPATRSPRRPFCLPTPKRWSGCKRSSISPNSIRKK